MPRNRRPSRARSNKFDPNILVVEGSAIAVADTASNNSIITISTPSPPMLARYRGVQVSVTPGTGTATFCLFVIRRVPQGYTAPAITVAAGTSAVVDDSNVMAYGMININLTSATATGFVPDPITLIPLRRTLKMYPGDVLTLQGVSNAASTGQTFSAFGDIGLAIA